jgi:hypothetical protein
LAVTITQGGVGMETAARGPVGNTRSIGLSILWFVLTLGIYSFFWVYRTYDEMQRHSGRGLGGPIGLVIYLVSLFTYVAVVATGILVWSELEKLYEDDGRQAPHTALWGLWLLLPLVGHFVWFIPTQRALNEYWESKGAPPA